MAWNYYYKDRAGGQNGPVSLEELAALARAGRIAPDCHVWAEGGEPGRADKIPALAEAFQSFPGAAASSGSGPQQPELPVWGLFWRSIAASIGIVFVIPAPWAGLWFYRWLTGRIALPNCRPLFLQSSVNQCWPIFVGLGLVGAALGFVEPTPTGETVAGVLLILHAVLAFLLTRWLSRAVRSEDGALKVSFEGGFWTFLGWSVLFLFAVETIIGWAWILKLMMRWICRQTMGTHQFEFVGSGVSILWRSFAAALGCAFILPIPWMIRWYTRWFISQIVVTPAAADVALPQAA